MGNVRSVTCSSKTKTILSFNEPNIGRGGGVMPITWTSKTLNRGLQIYNISEL